MLQGGAASAEMFANNEALRDEFLGHNIMPLAGGYSFRYSLFCTKDLGDVEQARGTLSRTGGQHWGRELEAMGQTPVPLPVGEMYEGLQRGVVDCVVLNPNSNITWGLWEVADYFYQIDMSGFPGSAWIMNLDTWNSLPAEAQEIIRDEINRYWGLSAEVTLRDYARFATEGVEEMGVQFGEVESFNEVLADYHAELEPRVIDEFAPPGLEDPEAFVEEYKAILAKWEDILVNEFDLPQEGGSAEVIRQTFIDYADLDVSGIAARLTDEIAAAAG